MITCYEGRQGSGKTAVAVLDAFRRLRYTGGDLYSNMRSLKRNKWTDKVVNRDFKIVPVRSYEELKRVTKGVVLLDEGHVWFFSRQWNKFPYDLLFFWSQARKRQLEIIYTVQDLERIDSLIRDLTDEVVRLRRLWAGVSLKWRREGIDKKYKFRWLALYKKAFEIYDSWEVIWFPYEGFERYDVGINFINEIESSLYNENPPEWFKREKGEELSYSERWYGSFDFDNGGD